MRSFQIHQAALFRDAPLAPIRGRPNKTRGKKVLSTIPGWHTAVRGTLLYVIEKQRKAETYHWKLEYTNISGLEHWQSTNTYCIDCIGARSLQHSCIVRNATRRCKIRETIVREHNTVSNIKMCTLENVTSKKSPNYASICHDNVATCLHCFSDIVTFC